MQSILLLLNLCTSQRWFFNGMSTPPCGFDFVLSYWLCFDGAYRLIFRGLRIFGVLVNELPPEIKIGS